jgi:hypothetical protein
MGVFLVTTEKTDDDEGDHDHDHEDEEEDESEWDIALTGYRVYPRLGKKTCLARGEGNQPRVNPGLCFRGHFGPTRPYAPTPLRPTPYADTPTRFPPRRHISPATPSHSSY